MPTLSKPELRFKRTVSENMFILRVKGEIHFNGEELQAMKQGRKYKLKCTLWGADDAFNGDDDFLVPFRPKRYTGGGHQARTPYEFEWPLSADQLDEDDSLTSGNDDIFARLSLRDLSIHKTVDRRVSNEWSQDI